MKTKIALVLGIVVLASCSAPKYSYYFDHKDYYSGKKPSRSEKVAQENSPLAVDPSTLEASISNEPATLPAISAESETEVRKTYAQMNKAERKELRHHLKKEIKAYIAEKKNSISSAHAGNAIDKDLKLAAIFGAVGVVGLIIGGDVFYIVGAIALLIGVVFFVKWLIRQ